MRICSLLPSGTEILFALGLDEEIVGVSHECDYPPQACGKPKLIHTAIEPDRLSSTLIDQAVRESIRRGEHLYQVDTEALRGAKPDLIVTQELCEVCAIDTDEVAKAIRALDHRPQLIALHPHTLADMLKDIRLIGERIDRREQAAQLLASLQARIERVKTLVAGRPRPRVFCLEWLKPPMASGHWVPEQVEIAGGTEVLGRVGEPSRYVTWDEIAAAKPEVLILMPCGFSIERTRTELSLITEEPLWRELPAVRAGKVYLVDGPAYFNRSGPRLVDGIELLAGLLHPAQCKGLMPCGAVETAPVQLASSS